STLWLTVLAASCARAVSFFWASMSTMAASLVTSAWTTCWYFFIVGTTALSQRRVMTIGAGAFLLVSMIEILTLVSPSFSSLLFGFLGHRSIWPALVVVTGGMRTPLRSAESWHRRVRATRSVPCLIHWLDARFT